MCGLLYSAQCYRIFLIFIANKNAHILCSSFSPPTLQLCPLLMITGRHGGILCKEEDKEEEVQGI